MYNLDIETLIGVLQNRRIQSFLEADLSTGGASGALKNGSVKVELKEGKIISISISDTNGRMLYQGQEAFNKIRRLVLTWQLTETSLGSRNKEIRTDPTSPSFNQTRPVTNSSLSSINLSPVVDMGALVPVRRQNLPPESLRFLSRSARSVYALVNGANSIRRIAGLLSLSMDVVYRELLELQRGQLVAFLDDRNAW